MLFKAILLSLLAVSVGSAFAAPVPTASHAISSRGFSSSGLHVATFDKRALTNDVSDGMDVFERGFGGDLVAGSKLEKRFNRQHHDGRARAHTEQANQHTHHAAAHRAVATSHYDQALDHHLRANNNHNTPAMTDLHRALRDHHNNLGDRHAAFGNDHDQAAIVHNSIAGLHTLLAAHYP